MATTSASRFICRYRFIPHLVAATCRSLAATSIVAIRKCAYYPRSSADFTHQPLQGVVGFDAAPVLRRHGVVAQRLFDAVLHDLCSLAEPDLAQPGHYLLSSFLGCLGVFLGMDGLQHGRHFFHLARWHSDPHVAIEMHGTTLATSLLD